MAKPVLLSIVISCYTTERLRDILDLLGSVEAQDYKHIETVIVVEKSQELLDQLRGYAAGDTRYPVRVVFNSGETGLSAARNLGVAEAKGDVIAFVDDDALLSASWAQEMINTYVDESVIGVTGSISPLWQDGEVGWFPAELDWILGATGFANLNAVVETRNVFGANMSFRKEAFELGGLFLTSLGAKGGGTSGKHELVGEETELSMRVRDRTGKRLMFNPKVRAEHKVYSHRITPTFIARRAYWEGYTKALFNRSRSNKHSGTLLNVEHDLLGRILTRLLPRIFFDFFRHPIAALRKLSVTVNALFFVAVGYLHSSVRSLRPGSTQNLIYE